MKEQAYWLSIPVLLGCTQLEQALWLGLLGATVPLLSQYATAPLAQQLGGAYRRLAQLIIGALCISLINLLLERYNLPLAQQLAPWLGLTLLPCLYLSEGGLRLTLQRTADFLVLALALGGLNSLIGLLQSSPLPWYQASSTLAQPSLNFLLLGALLALSKLFSKDRLDER